jgi:phosphohistidine phosphatase SixA
MRRAILLLPFLLLGLAGPPARAEPGLLAALREGGLVIFLRHAETGEPFPDHVGAVLGDCATQRNLNDRGVAQAVAIGEAVRRLGVPVGEVLASPFCRSMETAALAFGQARPEMALSLPRHLDAAAHAAMGAALLALVAAHPPAPGTNLVLVGHSYHLIAAGGPRPEPQGAAAVLRPRPGGGFTTLAMLPPGGWEALGARRLAETR